jgi:hypothetical protein
MTTRKRGSAPKKKPRISIASAKDKARRLQKYVAQKITDITGIPNGKDCLIESREMGQDGVDVKLYGIAREKFPFAIECKNQETWSVPAFIRQAKVYAKGDLPDWLLFMKKNYHEEIVVMDANFFFDLYGQYLDFVFGNDHKEKINGN